MQEEQIVPETSHSEIMRRHVFAAKSVDEVILVTSIEDRAAIQKMVSLFHPSVPVRYADGGAERQESVYHGRLFS